MRCSRTASGGVLPSVRRSPTRGAGGRQDHRRGKELLGATTATSRSPRRVQLQGGHVGLRRRRRATFQPPVDGAHAFPASRSANGASLHWPDAGRSTRRRAERSRRWGARSATPRSPSPCCVVNGKGIGAIGVLVFARRVRRQGAGDRWSDLRRPGRDRHRRTCARSTKRRRRWPTSDGERGDPARDQRVGRPTHSRFEKIRR